jgi:hypothetical protein
MRKTKKKSTFKIMFQVAGSKAWEKVAIAFQSPATAATMLRAKAKLGRAYVIRERATA